MTKRIYVDNDLELQQYRESFLERNPDWKVREINPQPIVRWRLTQQDIRQMGLDREKQPTPEGVTGPPEECQKPLELITLLIAELSAIQFEIGKEPTMDTLRDDGKCDVLVQRLRHLGISVDVLHRSMEALSLGIQTPLTCEKLQRRIETYQEV